MNIQNVFKRYEIKYLITKKQDQLLKLAMEEHMTLDQYGKKTIRNIYFDMPNKLLIRRSIEKPLYKEKLRVRSYDLASAESQVFIELKKKYDKVVYKRRMSMSEAMSRQYLKEGQPLENSSQISREIDYFMTFYKGIEPSIFLSYEREAFYGIEDQDFRMTFDEEILFRDYDLSLQSGIYGERILDKGMVILEVKTALGIPMWLNDFFSENKIYKTSFSKYGNAYELFMLPKSLGGRKDVA